MLLEANPNMENQDLTFSVKNLMLKHQVNTKGLKEVFKTFLFEVDCINQTPDEVEANLVRMFSLFYKKHPKQRIVVQGPPGSGRTT
jgi:hypothetical protein